MNNPRRSQGVALITALLIVALASVAAVSLATQQQLDIRLTGNLIDGDQAWAYARGAEGWVKIVLRRDLKRSEGSEVVVDHLGEQWAQPISPKLPGGRMVARISDAQARFNLNNLVSNGQVNAAAVAQLQSLLVITGLEPGLAGAIVDWMDRDINPRYPNGAEDDYYTGLEQPYLAANQPMVSVSELRLVKGFNDERYQRIAPFVTALPPPPTTSASGISVVATTPINVNTAPPAVLATLGLDIETARSLVELRQENPFQSPTAFSEAASTLGANLSSGADAVATASGYFEATIEARIGYGQATLVSLFLRQESDTDIQVVRRAQGVL